MRYVVVELEAQPETVADGNIVAVHGPWWDDGLAHDWARRQAEAERRYGRRWVRRIFRNTFTFREIS